MSDREKSSVDVVIVTCREGNALHLPEAPTEHVSIEFYEGPKNHFGYRCHQIMREAVGAYDWYCFIEDDIALIGDDFFEKMAFFTAHLNGPGHILMPNRYERDEGHFGGKVYIDHYHAPDRVRNLIEVETYGRKSWLEIALNPHSGCFFLTREQMDIWSREDWIFQRQSSWPLEDAATFRLVPCFTIWKPAQETPWLIEVEHLASRYQIPRETKRVSLEGLSRNQHRYVIPPVSGPVAEKPRNTDAEYAILPLRMDGSDNGRPFMMGKRFLEQNAPPYYDAWRQLLLTLLAEKSVEDCLAFAFRLLRRERLSVFTRFHAPAGRSIVSFTQGLVGRILWETGDPHTGAAYLRLAIANDPDGPHGAEARGILQQLPLPGGTGPTAGESCERYLRLARDREAAGRLHAATAFVRIACFIAPDNPTALLELARLGVRTQDFIEALAAAEAARACGAPADIVAGLCQVATENLALQPEKEGGIQLDAGAGP